MSARDDQYVTFGVGTYGKPAQQRLAELSRLLLIVGTTRTGKTRLGNSVARQQSLALGAGQIIINGKPDPKFIAEKARDAQRMGRSFLHFTMSPNGTTEFSRCHPYEPPRPCHYDPLARGSGAVRARMLIDSVVHNTASDVYRRNAIEIAALCWDIAAVSGAEWGHSWDADGAEQVRRKQPLETLLDMLDMEELVRAAEAVTPELMLRKHPHMHPDDARRMVGHYQSRAHTISDDSKNKSSTIHSAIADTRSIVASFLNSSAFYPQTLSIGAAPSLRIDLLRAIVRGEFVMFSLSAADYKQEATMLASMILLDLQNTVSTLRDYRRHLELAGDSTPWPPVIVQIEELGTVANPASAESLIGLVNKSADVGVRPIASTQALSDLRKIGDDSDGTYLKRLLGLTSDIISLQIGEDADDTDFCDYSGKVTKKVATEDVEVTNNRLGIFTGARQSSSIRATDTELPRVPYGTAQNLRSWDKNDIREMVWVTKAPTLSAVHTTGPEGPNNWFEIIQMVPVGEPPSEWNPFADEAETHRAVTAAKLAAFQRVEDERDTDTLLGKLRAYNERRLSDRSLSDEVDTFSGQHLGNPSDQAPPADTPEPAPAQASQSPSTPPTQPMAPKGAAPHNNSDGAATGNPFPKSVLDDAPATTDHDEIPTFAKTSNEPEKSPFDTF